MDRNDSLNDDKWLCTPRELRAKLEEEGRPPWTSEQLAAWFAKRLPRITETDGK
jgi:hypothetical protein